MSLRYQFVQTASQLLKLDDLKLATNHVFMPVGTKALYKLWLCDLAGYASYLLSDWLTLFAWGYNLPIGYNLFACKQ